MGGRQSAASRRRPATPSRRDSLHAGVKGGHAHLSGHVPQPDGGAVAAHCQLAGGLLPGCDHAAEMSRWKAEARDTTEEVPAHMID